MKNNIECSVFSQIQTIIHINVEENIDIISYVNIFPFH